MTATCKPLDLAQFEGHTPGPWHVGMKPGPMVYANQHGTQVADCSFDNGGAHRTDARLIAAAPALLAECKRQREQIAKLRDALESISRERSAHLRSNQMQAIIFEMKAKARAALAASEDDSYRPRPASNLTGQLTAAEARAARSEEHTSELQSQSNLV